MSYPTPVPLTLATGTAGSRPPRSWRDPVSGLVHLAGWWNIGTANATAFTLPPGQRPVGGPLYLPVLIGGGTALLIVNADGTTSSTAASGASCFLDGLQFLPGL